MKTRFAIGFAVILLTLGAGKRVLAQAGHYIAGFDVRWIRDYEPLRADGVSTVGEPDWDAEPQPPGQAEAEGTGDGQAGAGDMGNGRSGEGSRSDEENPETAAVDGVLAGAGMASPEGWVSLGDDWVITYYCPRSCCNEQWAWQTSTQKPMRLHHTIAVDPLVIPYYTRVRIGGLDYEYVAEDCGGGIKGKRIDVLVDNCTLADKLGVDRNVEVWVQRQ